MANSWFAKPDLPLLSRVAEALRQSDREELDALSSGTNCLGALFLCAAKSEFCRVIMHGDIPLAVSGVGNGGDGTFAPWLVGTGDVKRYPLAFMRSARVLVSYYRERYAPLVNYVDARQAASCRFIEALGFVLEGERPLGDGMFRKFYMER